MSFYSIQKKNHPLSSSSSCALSEPCNFSNPLSTSTVHFNEIVNWNELVCPLSKALMQEPRMLLPCQHAFDRHHITAWYRDKGKVCPTCTQPFENMAIDPLRKQMIDGINAIMERMKQQNLSADELWARLPEGEVKDHVRFGIESYREGNLDLGIDIITEACINSSELEEHLQLILNKLNQEQSVKDSVKAAEFNSLSHTSSTSTTTSAVRPEESTAQNVRQKGSSEKQPPTVNTRPDLLAVLYNPAQTSVAQKPMIASKNTEGMPLSSKGESVALVLADPTKQKPRSQPLSKPTAPRSALQESEKKTDHNNSKPSSSAILASENKKKRPLEDSQAPASKLQKTEASKDVSKAKTGTTASKNPQIGSTPIRSNSQTKPNSAPPKNDKPKQDGKSLQKSVQTAASSLTASQATGSVANKETMKQDLKKLSNIKQLMQAIKNKQKIEDIVSMIDKNNANGSDEQGNRPLHLAVRHFKKLTALIDKLIANGADINQANLQGDTPLHIIAATSKTSTAKKLCKLGADKAFKNKAGKSPFDLAKDTKMQEILKF